MAHGAVYQAEANTIALTLFCLDEGTPHVSALFIMQTKPHQPNICLNRIDWNMEFMSESHGCCVTFSAFFIF